MTVLPDGLEDSIEELVQEKVEVATADLREENEALRKENNDLHERINELEARVGELEDENLHHRVNAISRGLSEAHDSIAGLEDDMAGLERAIEAGGVEVPEKLADIDPCDLLPIEKLVNLPDETAVQQLDNSQCRNLYRARYIWIHWDKLSYTTGDAENRGSHIKSADVKRALNTWDREKTTIESKTVERIFERLSKWSYDLTEIRQKDGERRLWRPGDWPEKRQQARNKAEERNHPLADGVVSGGG